jgi:hypothetical protein
LNARACPARSALLWRKIPKAEATTVIGLEAVAPLLFTVTVPAPSGVLDGRIAPTSALET